MPNLRNLTLTDLTEDPALVDWLADEGRPLLVAQATADDAPAAIASLANTIGGWVLVDLDGDLDVAELAADVEPAPPVQGAELPGGGAVLRVAASADTPHVSGDGAVFIRDHDGMAPADAAGLRALVERGERGRAAASERRRSRVMIEEAMRTPERLPGDAPILDPDSFGHEAPLEFILRATPVTVTPEVSAAARGEGAARLAAAQAIPLLVDPDAVAHRVATVVEGRVAGVYCTAERGGAPIFADLALDAGGVVAARLAERRHRDGRLTPEGLIDEVLLPLLRSGTGALDGIGASGRTFVSLEVRGIADLVVDWTPELSDVVRLDELLDEDRLVLEGALDLPARPDDLQALAEEWARGLARAAGLPAWD